MDKEVQEKIAIDCLVGWGYDISESTRQRMAKEILETLDKLGYCKPPEEINIEYTM